MIEKDNILDNLNETDLYGVVNMNESSTYEDEIVPPIVINDNKSSIVHKYTKGEDDVMELFSPSDERKYGEIIIDNDTELPNINILDDEGNLVSLHRVGIESKEDDDINVKIENKEGVEVFTLSHKKYDENTIESKDSSIDSDITVVSNIGISTSGHIESVEKTVISKPLILDIKVDSESVVNKDRVAEISFDTLVKQEEYDDTIKEISDAVAEIDMVFAESLTQQNKRIESLEGLVGTGIKTEYKLTIDGTEFDGSKEVKITTLKDTAGLTEYKGQKEIYLVGGEKNVGKDYDTTYTNQYNYIDSNGCLYTKHDIFNSDGTIKESKSEKVATQKYVGEEISKVVANAPENLDTLKEIAEYISSDNTGAANIGSTVAQLSIDNVIGKGEKENSAVLKNLDNKTFSKGAVALGSGNIGGISGYYINTIDTNNKCLYLSNERTITQLRVNVSPTALSVLKIRNTEMVLPYKEGDALNIYLNDETTYQANVVSVEGNVITVDNFTPELPIGENNIEYGTKEYHFSIYSYNKPNGGNVDYGQYSFVSGENSVAYARASHAQGIGLEATNIGETVVGKYNEVKTGEDATVFSVGIGTSDDDRKNAFEVTQSGDVYVGDTNLNVFIENSDGKVATSENIEINGGPLANEIKKAYGDGVIPSGTTLEDFIRALVFKIDDTFTFGTKPGSMKLLISKPIIKANIKNDLYVIAGTEIIFDAITSPKLEFSKTQGQATGFKYGYIIGDTIYKGKTIITTDINVGDPSGSYTLSASASKFIGTTPNSVFSTSNTGCVLSGCSLNANFGTNTYTVTVSTPSYTYGYNGIESTEALNSLYKPSGKFSTKLVGKGKSELTANTVSETSTFTVTGVYPVYTNISGDELSVDEPNTMCDLTSGNTLFFENVPAENIKGKETPFIFEYPETNQIVSFEMENPNKEGDWVKVDSTTYDRIQTGRTIKVGDDTMSYVRFTTDGNSGAGNTYKITLKNALSVK